MNFYPTNNILLIFMEKKTKKIGKLTMPVNSLKRVEIFSKFDGL